MIVGANGWVKGCDMIKGYLVAIETLTIGWDILLVGEDSIAVGAFTAR